MSITSDKLIEKLFFIAGLTAGMTCIGLYSGNGGITLFTLIQFLLVLAALFLRHPVIQSDRINSPFFGLIICIVVSPVINCFILPPLWQNRSLKDLLSNILGLASFYLLYGRKDILKYRGHFVKGLKINFVIQAFWTIAQFVIGHVFGVSLNYYIGLYMPKVLEVTEVSGLTWERAELSLVLIIGYILFEDNLFMRMLAIVCLLLTGSRTALIMASVLVLLTFNYKRILLRKTHRGIHLKDAVVVFIAIVLLMCFSKTILDMFSKTFYSIKNYRHSGSGMAHFQLYERVFLILTNISLPNLLFGFSGGCSGYPYSLYVGRNIGLTWTVESTILSYLFSYGIVGLASWFMWMMKSAKDSIMNRENDIGRLFWVIVIGSFFYSLLSNWGLTDLLILAETIKEPENEPQHHSLCGT